MMRKWLAGKLVDLAVRLDWDAAVQAAKLFVVIDDSWKIDDPWKASIAKKKIGRPAGRKDSVGSHVWKPIPPKPKRGRPLGSKNKPKVQP
jgi:hypothetical protein